MNSTTPAPARSDAGARSRLVLWLSAGAVALAVGAGAALIVAPDPAPPGPTASEAARAGAQSDAGRLALAAAALASPEGPAHDGAPSEGVRRAAARAAGVLGRQRDLLAAGPGAEAPTSASAAATAPASASALASGSASVAASEPLSPSAGPSTTAPAPSPAELADAVQSSAAQRRDDLPRVDGPTARILASIAAAQEVQADALRRAAGVAPPAATPEAGPAAAPETSPAAGGAAGPGTSAASSPACPSPGVSASGSASGSTSASTSASPAGSTAEGAAPGGEEAAAVVRAEQAAVWTYTVLAARSDAATRAGHLAAAEAHRAQLDAARAVAAASCVRLGPDEPGFALAPDAASPSSTAALEGSAAQAWSVLVGAVPPAQRGAAADGLAAAARRIAALSTGAQDEAFPGHPEAEAALRGASTAPSPTAGG